MPENAKNAKNAKQFFKIFIYLKPHYWKKKCPILSRFSYAFHLEQETLTTGTFLELGGGGGGGRKHVLDTLA